MEGEPRWEDNIKMDIKEKLLEDIDSVHVAQCREKWWAFVNMVMNLGVP
jgi:hypothetical protein